MDNFYIKDSDEDGIQIQALLSACLQANPNIIRGGGEYKPPHTYEEFKEALKVIKKNAEELRAEIWEIRKRINDIQSYMLEYELMDDYNVETETQMYVEYGEIVDYQDYLKDIFDKYPNINMEVDNDNNNNNQ